MVEGSGRKQKRWWERGGEGGVHLGFSLGFKDSDGLRFGCRLRTNNRIVVRDLPETGALVVCEQAQVPPLVVFLHEKAPRLGITGGGGAVN